MKDLFRKILLFLIAVIAILYIYDLGPFAPKEEPKKEWQGASFEIDFIDVGQGDCILVSSNGKYALIDAGNNEDGEKLVKYFKDLGIQEFEYLIGTHAHEDHIGGLDNIMKSFSWNHLYMPKTEVDYKTYQEIIELANKQEKEVETPMIGSFFYLGNTIFRVLSIKDDKENINETSIVLRLEYKNTSYLLMGDATSTVEKEILEKNIKSDVLKVSHHGSYDASSAQFLYQVKPTYAIITAEENNEYGFPKKGIIKRLEAIEAKIYRTDQDGTIHVTSDGESIEITTEKTDTNHKEETNESNN